MTYKKLIIVLKKNKTKKKLKKEIKMIKNQIEKQIEDIKLIFFLRLDFY